MCKLQLNLYYNYYVKILRKLYLATSNYFKYSTNLPEQFLESNCGRFVNRRMIKVLYRRTCSLVQLLLKVYFADINYIFPISY